jgi:PAS domain S-box-containing protein
MAVRGDRFLEQRRVSEAGGRAAALPTGLAAERLFTALLRSSWEGMMLTRLHDSMILEISDAFVAMTGYTRGELIGRTSTSLTLVSPAVRDQAVASLHESGPVRGISTQLRTKAGEQRDVELSSDLLHDGKTAYVLTTLRDVTEQQRRAREMRRMYERFRSVFDSSPVPIIISRLADGTVIHANPACLNALGWAAADFVGHAQAGRGFWVQPERREALTAELQAQGRVLDYEVSIRRRNCDVRHTLASAELFDLDGEQCVIGTFTDITERKQAEQAMRAAEQRYRDLFENAVGAIFHASLDGGLLEVNHAFASLLGYDSPEQLKEETANVRTLYVEPRDRDGLLAAVGAQQRGTVERFEVQLRSRRGGTVWVTLDISPITDAAGDVTALREAAIDITARKRADEALRESEARFRLLAENSTDVISRHHPDGTLLYLSPACRRLFGYDPEDLVGQKAIDLLHPDDRAALQGRQTRESINATKTQTLVFRQRRQDGSYIWVEAAVRGVTDPESGEIIELQASTRDVSERVRADEQVRQAKERAEQANEEKSRFLSHISHDLRTPLAAILGFAELLQTREAVAGEKPREWVDWILQSGRHLLELVNQLLEVARIESGKVALAVVPVDARVALHEVLSLIAPLAAERDIRIADECTSDASPIVLADAVRLKQVLLNLLSNAIKYNCAAGVVSVTAETTGQATVRMTVSDTGQGISPEQLERLFSPFERLGAEAGPIEGTGLGLVIAKGLAEAMSGTLEVESEVGKGTTFSLELPAEPVGTTHSQTQAPASIDSSICGDVLYIEDNPLNIELVKTVLTDKRPNLTLRTASEGESGARLALEHPPDLLLLDLNLPDISGEEVLLGLRAHQETADLPVLVLSADSTSHSVQRLLETGADAYLTKPLDVEHFLQMVDRLVSDR